MNIENLNTKALDELNKQVKEENAKNVSLKNEIDDKDIVVRLVDRYKGSLKFSKILSDDYETPEQDRCFEFLKDKNGKEYKGIFIKSEVLDDSSIAYGDFFEVEFYLLNTGEVLLCSNTAVYHALDILHLKAIDIVKITDVTEFKRCPNKEVSVSIEDIIYAIKRNLDKRLKQVKERGSKLQASKDSVIALLDVI